MPGPSITRMSGIGIGLAVLGGGAHLASASSMPMSGAVMLGGGARSSAGSGPSCSARAMSQRTKNGRVRRRDAHRVPPDPAQDDGPGALDERGRRAAARSRSSPIPPTRPSSGASRSASTTRWRRSWRAGSRSSAPRPAPRPAPTTRRGSARRRARRGRRRRRARPAGGVSYGSGSIFSGSAMPDIGGMFDALGCVGSTPPSSSSTAAVAGAAGSQAAVAAAAEARRARFKRRTGARLHIARTISIEMSFNRRGGSDRRPDRSDRPDRDRTDRPSDVTHRPATGSLATVAPAAGPTHRAAAIDRTSRAAAR